MTRKDIAELGCKFLALYLFIQTMVVGFGTVWLLPNIWSNFLKNEGEILNILLTVCSMLLYFFIAIALPVILWVFSRNIALRMTGKEYATEVQSPPSRYHKVIYWQWV